MKRKALLIGAEGGISSNYLPGVSVDLKTVKSFLMSPQGGAWHSNEIITIEDATISEIKAANKFMHADYAITLFSGHGFSGELGNRYLVLTDGTHIKDLSLLNTSPRQLILVDACRNIVTGISGLPLEEEWSHFDGGGTELEKARRVYDNWISVTKPGKVVIHSTTHGNYSYDTSKGGAFTQKLLHVGNRVKKTEKFNLLNVYSCVCHVPKLLKKEGYSQYPQVTYRSGNINLPFAMALPIPKQDNTFAKMLLGLGIAGLVIKAFDDE